MNPDQQLRRCGQYRVKRAQEIALEGEQDGISGALLLAMGLRESDLQNVINPSGTDRGWLQVNDYWHKAWLATVPGCRVGSWHVASDAPHTALEKGYCPTFTDAARYAVRLLRRAIEFAIDHGIPLKEQVRFAIAAYNCGEGGAWKGWQEGNVDKYTAHGDYSKWVLERRTEVNQWLGKHPTWRYS